MTSARLTIVRAVCRPLPPMMATTIQNLLYKARHGLAENYTFVAPSRTGSMYHGSTAEKHAYRLYIHGYLMWQCLAIALAVCKPGDGVIEIGANVGTETIGFSDIVGEQGHVYAFEPVPSNIELLKLALSDARYKNVEIYPYALSDDNGQVKFVAPPSSHSTGVGHLVGNEDTKGKTLITVERVTLDSLSLPPVTAIFMDTEGAEPEILHGASAYLQSNAPFIVLEVNPRHLRRAGSSAESLHGLITSLGYQAHNIRRYGLGEARDDITNVNGTNWVCIPNSKREQTEAIDRMLRRSASLPFAFGLNPISHVS